MAELLVDHEEALQAFARSGLSGQVSDSTGAVSRVLERISAWENAQP